MVAKQQILATSGNRGGGQQIKRNLPRGVAHPMQMTRQAPDQDLLSPGLIDIKDWWHLCNGSSSGTLVDFEF